MRIRLINNRNAISIQKYERESESLLLNRIQLVSVWPWLLRQGTYLIRQWREPRVCDQQWAIVN
jgi:hypothetical protein